MMETILNPLPSSLKNHSKYVRLNVDDFLVVDSDRVPPIFFIIESHTESSVYVPIAAGGFSENICFRELYCNDIRDREGVNMSGIKKEVRGKCIYSTEIANTELIFAAKKLMCSVSDLKRLLTRSGTTRRDLSLCLKLIVDTSNVVTMCATSVNSKCKDRKLKLLLCQVAEKIPTLSAQLKMLVMVKAATIINNESVESINVNISGLMSAVKEILRATAAANIKIRVDDGMCSTWTRKQPWCLAIDGVATTTAKNLR